MGQRASSIQPLKEAVKGKTVLITGANSGLGYATARYFSKFNANVICGVRDEIKGVETVSKLQQQLQQEQEQQFTSNISYIAMDLNDLNQVRNAVQQIESEHSQLHYLINNAGFGMVSPDHLKQIPTSKQNIESHFQVNYLSHFYLTNLLLPLMMESSSPARITNVSSKTHYFIRDQNVINLQVPSSSTDFYSSVHSSSSSTSTTTLSQILTKEDEQWTPQDIEQLQYYSTHAYAISKFCQVMSTLELQRRLTERKVTNVTANVIHPGSSATNFYRHFGRPQLLKFFKAVRMMKDPDVIARNIVRVAADPQFNDLKGQYFSSDTPSKCSELAKNEQLARELWELSEHLINTRISEE